MVDKSIGYQPKNTMREILRDNSLLVMTVSRFGIPFGFGDETVESVCRDYDVDTDTFLTVCNLLSRYAYSPGKISLHSLIGYLKRAHSSFLDVTLPKIRQNLIEAISRSENNEITMLLIRFFDDYVAEVKHHMDNENDDIFEYVETLLTGRRNPGFRILDYSENHDHTVSKLNELKDIFIYHFKQRENARLSSTLFDIVMCEKDMMNHFEVETKLFIPAVEKLENSLELTEDYRDPTKMTVTDEEHGPLMKLSEREKDIVREIAKGLSNKEIAETLFISAHTVATHRRNIVSKLGIHSSAGLVIFAILHGLVDIKEVNPY